MDGLLGQLWTNFNDILHALLSRYLHIPLEPLDPQPLTDGGGGGGADFSKNYTHQSWHLYAQEGSGGACSPGKFWKLTPQMTHSRPYFGRNMVVCVFLGPWTGRGERAGCASLWIRHCRPTAPRPTTSLKNLLDPEKLKIGELYV